MPERASLDGEAGVARATDERGQVTLAHVAPGEHHVHAAADVGAAATHIRIAPWCTTNVRLTVAPAAEGAPATGLPSGADAGRVFGPDELRDRPRPSDVWSFVRDVPGVVLDRVDVVVSRRRSSR